MASSVALPSADARWPANEAMTTAARPIVRSVARLKSKAESTALSVWRDCTPQHEAAPAGECHCSEQPNLERLREARGDVAGGLGPT
jgi:hypothetical protein